MSVKTSPEPRVAEEKGRRPEPEHQAHRRDPERPGERWAGVRRQGFSQSRRRVGNRLAVPGTVPAPAEEGRVPSPAAEIADHACRENDERKRHIEQEDRHERDGGDRDHDVVLQRPPADPHDGLEHDRQHRGLQAEEERLDEPDIAEEA